jgi:dTMP kinase
MACFITFEGVEGCGKTTQIRLLAKRLQQEGHRVTLTREPGGCPIADQIRGILLDATNQALTPLAELLLYAAARAQHVSEVIRPALAAGDIVLCDRFTDATLAYQGFGRELDRSVIIELNRLATQTLYPDLTILMDCPVEIGLERAFARINAAVTAREERFELEARSFHERVRAGYLALARQDPERFVVIDGSCSVAATAEAVRVAVVGRLAGGRPCRTVQ